MVPAVCAPGVASIRNRIDWRWVLVDMEEFVERRDGSFYLIGSRVPLAHLVREFQQGELPEAIRSHYSTLSLEQVYGAITFYLGHKSEVENDIAERRRVEDEFTKTHPAPPHLKEKLERARQQLLARRT